MEKRVNKHYRKKFFQTIISYFIGSTLYQLLGGQSAFYRVMAALIFSGITWIMTDFWVFRKNPDLKANIKIEENDERNQLIQAKAGAFSFLVGVIVLLIVLLIGIGMNEPLVSNGAALLAAFLLATFFLASWLMDKKM